MYRANTQKYPHQNHRKTTGNIHAYIYNILYIHMSIYWNSLCFIDGIIALKLVVKFEPLLCDDNIAHPHVLNTF